MMVPFCSNCQNRTLVLGPKGTLQDELRVYCPECRTFYRLEKVSELNLPELQWVNL